MNYDDICTFETLYRAYREVRVGKRSKPGAAQYEAMALECTQKLNFLMERRMHQPSKFEVFTVYEPKKRLVQAPAFVDKVVQHALVEHILYEALTTSFIRDNHASQVDKGTHVGLDRLRDHMRDYYLKRKGRDEAARREAGLGYRPKEELDYAQGWILKADIRQFFASIDHDITKAKLTEKIADPDVYELMCRYIDASEGLPLGYETSQLLALMYMDDFDHWVKEKLHAKYYGRYMDDFYIIAEEKKYLQYCWREMEKELGELKLELNHKTNIFPLQNGIDFLGFHTYLDAEGKVIRKLRKDSLDRLKRNMRWWRKAYPEGLITQREIIDSWSAWDAHAAHGDTYELRRKMAKEVAEIVGVHLVARKPIRNTKKSREREARRKLKDRRKADQLPKEE